MAHEVMGIWSAGLGLVEVATYSLAALVLLRRWDFTLAEAAAGAALFPAMLSPFLLQLAHLAGGGATTAVVRPAFLAAAAVFSGWHHGRVVAEWRALRRFSRHHRLAAAVILATLVALAMAAAMSAGLGGHHLRPVGAGAVPLASLPANPLKGGATAWPGASAAVFLPWMAYLSICFATYALARRYAWPPTAVTVTLLVASMPRLVFLAVSGGVEITPAAGALLSILLLYRAVERPDIKDCLLLAVVLIFSISTGLMGLVYPLLVCGLAVVVLYRRHGGRIWWDLACAAPLGLAVAGPVLVIIAAAMLGPGRLAAGDGSSTSGLYNADGILGATANAVRYGLQMLDLTPPLEQLLKAAAGLDWNGFRLWLHDDLLPARFHASGSAAPLASALAGDRTLAWFGPFAALLFLPAVGWAWLRGPRRLKSLALALMAYLALAALIPAWMPGNVRYFTVFFVCAGFTAAFLLPPWRMTRRRRRFLQLSATALIVYAVGAVLRDMWMHPG